MKENILENFEKDTKDHKLDILLDQGIYRHLKLRRPNTGIFGFDIITWPGYLAISGDMGCYVFSRVNDMFTFFSKDYTKINLGCWAEKVQAQEKHSGIEKWSQDRLHSQLLYRIKDQFEDEQKQQECVDSIKDCGLWDACDAYEAHEAAESFDGFEGFDLTDFWEINCNDYTYQYIWCCHAICWAINKYEEAKKG